MPEQAQVAHRTHSAQDNSPQLPGLPPDPAEPFPKAQLLHRPLTCFTTSSNKGSALTPACNAPFAVSQFAPLGFADSWGSPMRVVMFPAHCPPPSLPLHSPRMDKQQLPIKRAGRAHKPVPGFFLPRFLPQTSRSPTRKDQSLYKWWCFSLAHKTLTPEIHLLKALGHDQIPLPFQFLGLHLHGLQVRPSRAGEGMTDR